MKSIRNNRPWHGVYTALVTPLDDRGDLDLEAFSRILDDQADAGVAGVVVCGTTGETPTLAEDERKTLIRHAIERLRGRGIRVLAGTGSNSTAQTVEMSLWAEEQGADGLLIVTPYYNKPSQAGLVAHYEAVANEVEIPIMLYNVPGRTGVSLAASSVAALARHPMITAIKEASGSVAFASEILDAVSREGLEFQLLSGDDALFLPTLAVGGCGVVSVASNLFPRAMCELQKAFDVSDIRHATEIHRKYLPLFRDLFIESNPVPVKEALAYAGWCKPHVRGPLVALTASSRQKLLSSLERCGVPQGRITAGEETRR